MRKAIPALTRLILLDVRYHEYPKAVIRSQTTAML